MKRSSAIKVCVCTSYPAWAEPRAPRHASALAGLGAEYEIHFVDCLPYGSEQTSLTIFQGSKNLSHQTCFFPFRGSHRVRFLFQKAFQIFSRCLFIAVGYVHPSALSTRALELEAMLKKLDADVYVGYNIDTLMTIHRVGSKKNAFTIFDCQEFYSDMGDAQSPLDRKIISAIERRYLPMCDLVLAASDEMADELAREYKIRRPLPLYNVPPVETNAAQKNETGFSLYWRNTTLDLGHRGLGDAIAALKLLPEDITFHIQGNLPTDGGKRLFDTIEKNDLSSRVIVHPPYVPHKAVSAASAYTLGLCLEQATSRNHLLTVSNKMFDYFMAGLPVIASDLPGLRNIIKRSRAGILYVPGNPEDLVAKILRVYNDENLLKRLSVNARSFALSEGNSEKELTKLRAAFLGLIEPAFQQAASAATC